MFADNEAQLNRSKMFTLQLATRTKAEIFTELVVFLLIGLIGVCGNFLVLLVISLTPSLRTISNFYVASLSAMELLLSLSIWIFIPEVVLKGTPTFGDAICQFVGFITAMLATGSIYSMALIAINRYFLMAKSNLHRKYFTKRNAYTSIAVSWILAGNFPVSYMLLGNKFKFHPGKGVCIFDVTKLNLVHAFLTGFFNIQLPYLIISCCYFKIYQRVKEHNALLRHSGGGNGSGSGISAKEIKVTKLLFAIVLSYTICWTPFYVIDLVGVFLGQFFAPRLVYVFYSIVVGSTTAISPIIYGVFNRELKGEIVKLLKSKFCCFCNKFKVGVPVTTSNRRP